MPGEGNDFIRRIIIPAVPYFCIFLIFVDCNLDILYHRLNTRRLGLILIPKAVLFPPAIL